MVDLEHNW